MKVIVDRIEGKNAVVEIEEGSFALLPLVLVNGVKEGDVIDISIDKEETEERKKKINNLMDELFI